MYIYIYVERRMYRDIYRDIYIYMYIHISKYMYVYMYAVRKSSALPATADDELGHALATERADAVLDEGTFLRSPKQKDTLRITNF